MRHTETVKTNIERTLYESCDKCGVKITSEDSSDAFDFRLEHTTGYGWAGECGEGKTQELALCKECAIKAVTLLKDNGYKIQESEWEI